LFLFDGTMFSDCTQYDVRGESFEKVLYRDVEYLISFWPFTNVLQSNASHR